MTFYNAAVTRPITEHETIATPFFFVSDGSTATLGDLFQ